MRHGRTGKKLGRDSAHRKALYATLACSRIEHGRIRTTEAKAKAVNPYAEKKNTLGRRGDLHARRQALAEAAEIWIRQLANFTDLENNDRLRSAADGGADGGGVTGGGLE
jgi:ribosomal protein L17